MGHTFRYSLTFLFPLHLVSAASTLYDTTPLPPHSIFRHRMRASAIITLAASTAILPSMCLPIRSVPGSSCVGILN